MTKLHQLAALGQSVWLDFIHRDILESGRLAALIADGVRGVTSNPAIFEKAIAGGADYDRDIARLADDGFSPEAVYEALAVLDVRAAADLLRPVYDSSAGGDGFVSLEVSPVLADDAEATVAEAARLSSAVGRPNLMIKIPATPAGIRAVESAVAAGISVNVTLIFSLTQYEAAAKAYIAGLERRLDAGGELAPIASVASIFVSRVDSAVDPLLAQLGRCDLMGRIAVDNAKLAYAHFREIFRGGRWDRLARAGGRLQRPLWASTGTKNPAYSDTLYVDNLVGPETVNTLPPATLASFMDHGTAELTLDRDLDASRRRLSQLVELGIDLDAVTGKLLEEGIAAFARPFESLMDSIRKKAERRAAP